MVKRTPSTALYAVLPADTAISVSEVQPENAFLPMLVTELGIVMLVSEVQPKNAFLPMVVTESGIVTLISEVHPANVP